MDFSGTGAPTTASPASPAPSRERSGVGPGSLGCGRRTMPSERRVLRCAVYTRKSSEHGLEQDFNSLDAQREAGEAYIKSQSHEGWKLIRTAYDDGGLSGATMERPALQRLLAGRGAADRCGSGHRHRGVEENLATSVLQGASQGASLASIVAAPDAPRHQARAPDRHAPT